ncbi:uncharacterized protein LOC101766549 isoform X2 [Setaria italica]|uniref:BZIP domain-containing protein n=2 Tax=Setaria TaxID=4554 RepID=K3YK23_SETIT|nr:uncharacterized protein LOC101766549 isoform X2 [Setaria italica]XP_034600648.1 uncharacterized protein LOC117861232 isoform X2 [Setaria viridis]TKW09917.1 hypothetical protein SEVIR_6G133000v2 [Setaria viridis]
MSQILSEAILSGFMINSTLRRGTHLVLSFSVVFLYWFYVFSVDQLRTTKQQLLTALNNTTQNYAAAEAQNSVLRTQMIELESRLSALRDIICYMNANLQVSNSATINANPSTIMGVTANYDAFDASAWNSGMPMVQQPIDHLLYQCF